MFLQGTLHIFLCYLGIGLILCVPPFLGFWKRLVEFLNQRGLEGIRLARILGIGFPPLLFLSLMITHLFQFHKELGISFFLFFAPASFVIIPFLSAYFGIIGFARLRKKVGLGELGVLLFGFGGFGAAGANLHDVLWCGRATRIYTIFKPGGNDLWPWVDIFSAPSYDYRIFGFYMMIQVVIALAMAHLVYLRWMKFRRVKLDLAPLRWNWLGMTFLAFAITIIDWPEVIQPALVHTALIGLAVIFACIFFYLAGRKISLRLVQEKADGKE